MIKNQRTRLLILSIVMTGLVMALLMMTLGGGQAAYARSATTLTVISTDDSGPGTLRQTIDDANPGDTIEFNLTYPAVITLISDQLSITKSLTINGPGAANLTISGDNAHRVIYITSTVTISGVTVANGNAGECGYGGGIYNDGGTLTVRSSIFLSNTACSGGGILSAYGILSVNESLFLSNTATYGAGIYNVQNRVVVTNSTVAGNLAIYGGILNNNGVMTLANSAIISNTSFTYGGGIINYNGMLRLDNSTVSWNSITHSGSSAIDQFGTNPILVVNNSTIVDNTSNSVYPPKGSVWVESGALTLTNSIVANNNISSNFRVEAGATFTSQGHNLSNDWNGVLTDTTDLTGDPLLGPLADNGGSTWTHALLPGSPGIDQIPLGVNGCGTLYTQDQRGLPRPSRAGGSCDIGAFELQGFALTLAYVGNGSGSVTIVPPSPLYPAGMLITLSATPLISSTFTGWTGDVVTTTNPVTLTMDADKSVTATFTLKTFVITPTTSANGSIIPGIPQSINYGDDITFTIVADTGYHIADVGVDGVSQGAMSSYAFNDVTADHIITAVFALNLPVGLSAINNSPTALGSRTTLTATTTSGLDVVYTWNFGDGNSGLGATATHTYLAAGTYTASVTATNSGGSLTATTTVYVTTAPIALAGPDQTVRPYRSVTLDGSGSLDLGNFLPLTYHWQQTDGQTVALTGADNVTATFTTPAITQTQVLTFTLTVTNTQGIASLPEVVVVAVEPYRVMLPLVLK